MARKDLIIIGAGGHAHSVIDVVESGTEYRIVGLIDSTLSLGDKAFGYEVLGAESDLDALVNGGEFELFIAIGDNFHRQRVYRLVNARLPTTKFATLTHPDSQISKRASLGAGTVVMAGAIINAGCHIDDGVIINTGAVIDHDGSIGRFSSLAPLAAVGGSASIGKRTAIGLGAKLIHNISIAHDVCVGAGSLVLKSIERTSVVVYGTPAKVVRRRQADEAYL